MDEQDFNDQWTTLTPTLRRKMSSTKVRDARMKMDGEPYEEEGAQITLEIQTGKPLTKKQKEKEEEENGGYEYQSLHDEFDGDAEIAFDLVMLPGCCGVLVLHDLEYSNKLTHAQVDLVMGEFLSTLGLESEWGDLVVATTIPEQGDFTSWLKRAKFKVTQTTYNPRSHNIVTMFGKDLSGMKRRGRKTLTPRPRVGFSRW